jgi:glycosyltransferase involved in cell wall biosynthesis
VRTVLHVLPHAGGGGETYVRALARIEGYRAERTTLAGLPFGLRPHALLHVHGEVAAGLCVAGLLLRPSVVTLHGLHFLRRCSGLQRRLATGNLRVVLRAATRVICVSRLEYAELVDTLGAHAARHASVVLNGVEPRPVASAADKAALRAELGLPADAVVAAFAATLDAVKDPLTAVSAAAQSGVALLVAGDGPLRAQVEAAAAQAGGGQVRVLGQRTDTLRILAAADIFLLPSKREGLSFSVLEAMSQGLAPVVSDAPGNVEAVGDAGLVAPYGDAAGFAAALARLRDDADLRSQLGAKARTRVQREFSAERMLRETKAVYDGMM